MGDAADAAVSSRLRWDVFLSFIGEDTRHTIAHSLYKSFDEQGIRAFRDDEDVEDGGMSRGDEMAPSLSPIDAIYDSAASIIILSPKYGSSRRCLEGLAKICELNRLILPVFYQVDPSNVRRQEGPFKEDFKRHEERFGKEVVSKWREAMGKVGGISGWVFNNSDEEQSVNLVQLLVKRVLTKLSNTPIRVAAYTVGIDSRVEELMKLLDVKSSGVRVLGLHGMGGVGKTTLAKAVYNKLVGKFECRSFITNVREISRQTDGLISLQHKLIDDLSLDNTENLQDPGNRSRLWDRDEITTVLKLQKGTRNIRGIVLDLKRKMVMDSSVDDTSWENLRRGRSLTSAIFTYLKERCKKFLQHRAEIERELVLCTKPFESMVNLRLLQINHVKLEGKFKFLPAELKWLQWKQCTEKTLPSDFSPSQLTVLDLSESGIERVWDSNTNKVAKNLMVLNLLGCWNLAAVPDLSEHPILEKLVLERCTRLTKIHESVGDISTLLHLNLSGCSNLIEFPRDVSALKHLETLVLSGCSKLSELPEDIGNMESLKELLLEKTAIAKLPLSVIFLVKLEKLNLSGCLFLKELPQSIGKLVSLKEFSLDHSAIEELPDSVGYLGNLEKLSLIGCGAVTAIPGSVGNLRSLTEFLIDGTAVKELPPTIGQLSYLKAFSVSNCRFLSKLPESIERLASIVELQLDGLSITDLPDQIGGLKMVDKLEMRNCSSLRKLPESIGSMSNLTTLTLFKANITELPLSIGMLENLVILRLNKCKQLQKFPASIGKLKSLVHLLMEETAMTELPESFGMLSRLMVLRMAKRPPLGMLENGETVQPKLVVLPTSFSNLSLLEELDARAWRIGGKIPDDFEKLSSLEILNLGKNNFHSLPSSLSGLSLLKKLLLPHCEELKSLPPLPSSLQEVNIANCFALESIYDLSNLGDLYDLNLTNCEKVLDIPGLECLNSLRTLYMSGCNSCFAQVQRRLSKVSLKKLNNLSMPGSKIPSWFSQEVTFSKHKNREIKGVIIAVVVSINNEIPDDLRYQLPAIVDIHAKILAQNKTRLTTALHLLGVPKTNQDHVHLCRYPACHPLVSMLKDGYKIQVVLQNPPFLKGVELKKCGIYLVFENDDDYDGDEESLDENQQSVSAKLAKFFGSLEDEH
ncbi:hypothetical protein Q3G72_029781 [Acer saccharum]|nr:hypothetical protein Q3G72_029781 [Acer saccharum]